MTRAGFPHSDILGSRFVCQLPEAYRRLQRPSSAPSAKASTLCPYKLDHKKSFKKDARVHCAVLKLRPAPAPSPQHLPPPRCSRTNVTAVCPSGTSPQPPAPTPHPQVQTACVATLNEQPSGCSLRTQQRAQPTPPQQQNRSHPTPRAGVLGRHQLESRPQSMFHPRAPSPTRSAGTTGLDTLHPPRQEMWLPDAP